MPPLSQSTPSALAAHPSLTQSSLLSHLFSLLHSKPFLLPEPSSLFSHPPPHSSPHLVLSAQTLSAVIAAAAGQGEGTSGWEGDEEGRSRWEGGEGASLLQLCWHLRPRLSSLPPSLCAEPISKGALSLASLAATGAELSSPACASLEKWLPSLIDASSATSREAGAAVHCWLALAKLSDTSSGKPQVSVSSASSGGVTASIGHVYTRLTRLISAVTALIYSGYLS